MNENGKTISDKDKDIIGELIGSLSKKEEDALSYPYACED